MAVKNVKVYSEVVQRINVVCVPGLGNVHRHGGCCCDQTTDHTGNKVEEQAVPEITCTEA